MANRLGVNTQLNGNINLINPILKEFDMHRSSVFSRPLKAILALSIMGCSSFLCHVLVFNSKAFGDPDPEDIVGFCCGVSNCVSPCTQIGAGANSNETVRIATSKTCVGSADPADDGKNCEAPNGGGVHTCDYKAYLLRNCQGTPFLVNPVIVPPCPAGAPTCGTEV